MPDRRRDGTNVLALPVGVDAPAAYGGGSFARHLDRGAGRRLPRRGAPRSRGWRSTSTTPPTSPTRRSLPHLPTWLRTILDNRPLDARPGRGRATARSPSSALAVGAHPDDVEFGAGGTLAKWAAAGCVVHHVVCTDGSKGTWDAAADLPALVARRQGEQREAARRLAGDRAGEVRFLGRVDGDLAADRATVSRASPASSASCGPTSCSATTRGSATACTPTTGTPAGSCATPSSPPATRTSSPSTASPTHRPAALLLWEADEPNHAEDVSGFVDRKLAALEAHESQFETTMHAADASELDAFRDRIRTRLADLGAPHGLAAAEVFALLTDL